jgi:NADPH-dependent F420 reductase
MDTIAILGGTGDLGFGLALRLAKAGYRVVIGSRRREKAMESADKAIQILGGGKSLRGGTNSEAVADADIVFFSIPFQGAAEIAGDIAGRMRHNCVAVSCMVPFEDNGLTYSAAEFLAGFMPKNVAVVSALHTVSAERLARISEPVDTDTFVFGDVWEAKKRVAAVLRGVDGLRPVDGGPLKNSRIGERLVKILLSVNKRYRVKDAGIRVSGLGDDLVRSWWEL